jgi:hypothetical protein
MIDALPLLLGPEGYQISRSVRLRSSASAYLNRTPGSAGDRQKFTISFWMKRGTIGTLDLFTGNNANGFLAAFRSDNTLYLYDAGAGSGGLQLWSARVFRDPSAWYHIVIAVDTTQATDTNRLKVYINGVQETLSGWSVGAGASRYPSLNANLDWNNTNSHEIGYALNYGYFDGYLAEFNNVSGQQLDASSFGETNLVTGVWQPKKYTGTYGTNGFYLNFSDNSAATAAAIGKDYSGNGNNWTPNNISVTAGVTYDSMLDVPTQWGDGGNGRGNYATFNPLKNTASLSSANLQSVNAASSGYYTSYSTMEMVSGKYYWELTAVDDGANARFSGFGIADPTVALTSIGTGIANTPANNSRGWIQTARSSISVYGTGLYNNGASVNTTTRATTTGTRIFMIAYDADTGKCWMGYEGTWWSGDPAAGTSQYFTASAPMMPVLSPYNDGSNANLIFNINFGQRPFAYTPPTGFKALNTLNLPTPTILKGNQYFNAVTFTGDGVSSRNVTGVGFDPDFVWFKSRSAARNHRLKDVARGNNFLSSDTTAAEAAYNSIVPIQDGISVLSASNDNVLNETYVFWNWKEGPTQGFDIVTWTAPSSGSYTVAHSLGVAPKMVIIKSRSSGIWSVMHTGAGAMTSRLQLESTAAATASVFTAPTSTLINLGSSYADGTNYVAYLFSEVAGFSRFGSYTGNGSADGPFVFCGFRPRFVMWKNVSVAEAWLIEDAARSTFNQVALELYPSSSGAEAAGSSRSPTQQFDFLSNGFKVRGANNQTNGSGNTIIFAAFSESPFKNSLAR